MSKLKKAKDRIISEPKDYTYSEAKSLLISLGFVENSKGKTSGSRVMFYRNEDKLSIMLHKPHPGDEMKLYAIRQLKVFLKENGEI